MFLLSFLWFRFAGFHLVCFTLSQPKKKLTVNVTKKIMRVGRKIKRKPQREMIAETLEKFGILELTFLIFNFFEIID